MFKARNKVRLFTLNPVFPKSCPGCGSPADSTGAVPVAVTHNLNIPMCSRCAKYIRSVMIPLYILVFVSGLILSLIFYLSVAEPPERSGGPLFRVASALCLILFWALVFAATYIFLFNKRPVYVMLRSRTHSPFSFILAAKNSDWAEQLEKLNELSVPAGPEAAGNHGHRAEGSGKTAAEGGGASTQAGDRGKQATELLDLAVDLYIKAAGDDEHERIKQQLSEKFPIFTLAEIDALYGRVGDLIWTSYQVYEKTRDKKITREEGMLEIKNKSRGFSEKAIDKAVGHGFFSAR